MSGFLDEGKEIGLMWLLVAEPTWGQSAIGLLAGLAGSHSRFGPSDRLPESPAETSIHRADQ